MAINDDWEYRRTPAELNFTVYTVELNLQRAYAQAVFAYRVDAEKEARSIAEVCNPRYWGTAVVDNSTDFVYWTSF